MFGAAVMRQRFGGVARRQYSAGPCGLPSSVGLDPDVVRVTKPVRRGDVVSPAPFGVLTADPDAGRANSFSLAVPPH